MQVIKIVLIWFIINQNNPDTGTFIYNYHLFNWSYINL